MPAPIVVEVYAPAPRPQELAALIMACTRAAAPKECVTSEAKGAEPPLGVAIVRRDGERARIELGLRSAAPSAAWSTRDLVFQPGDDELERYRAIGFAIGTLVAGQAEPASPAPSSEPAPPPLAPKPTPKPASKPPAAASPAVDAPPSESAAESPSDSPSLRRTQRSLWFDASGSVGLGLIPGPPRVGGALRAALELVPHSLFVVVEGGYAERLGDAALRARWLNAAAGLGHPLAPQLRSVGVDVRLLIAFEQLSVTTTEGALTASASRWKPGVVAAIDGYWNVTRPLGILLSASTFIDPKRTVVRSSSQQAGETPALGFSGYVGLRFKLR